MLTSSNTKIWASHIVGGELQMYHQRGENYLIRLILYYDQANAEFDLIDKKIDLGIFRKTSNTKIDDTELEFIKSVIVNYSNPNCLPDSLKTVKIVYEGIYRFNRSKYNDPGGYYMSWERCCRNNIISNIFQPGTQGMVFLLEFPSIVHQPGNSSPVFDEINGEYICLNKYTELNYGARDPDGDSLRYYLDIPLIGFTNPNSPVTNLIPGPYPEAQSYYLMPGNPFLNVDETNGILSVRPTQSGLFVFRLVCEEYRNGIKIGAINRDFQILVNECKDNLPPFSVIYDQDNSAYQEGDTLYIRSREELCFPIKITDRDKEKRISYRISPINFSHKDVQFNPETGSSTGIDDTLMVEMCWPDCRVEDNQELYEFYLIVEDDACPNTNVDSTKIILKVSEEDNNRPSISSEFQNISWAVGIPFEMWLNGEDPDESDSLTFSLVNHENKLNPIIYQRQKGNPAEGIFGFLATCKELSDNAYNFTIHLRDNSCASNNSDSITFSALINQYKDSENEFVAPANVITPNGDGYNDVFYFDRPPLDICEFQEFESVVIYNRWGIKIFESENRDFKWAAEDLPSGEYFYLIKFNKSAFKGYLHVIK